MGPHGGASGTGAVRVFQAFDEAVFMMKFLSGSRPLLLSIALFTLAGCSSGGGGAGGGTADGQGATPPGGIASARIVPGSVRKIPSFGDLWLSTWSGDGAVYMAWGDGTGPGTCYPLPADTPPEFAVDRLLTPADVDTVAFGEEFCAAFPCDGTRVYSACELTQAGVYRLDGPVGDFTGCQQGACIRNRHIPTGLPQFKFNTDPKQRRGDKPSSLLAVDGILYWAGHQLMTAPRYGYIAWSADQGKTWTEVPGSPWTEGSHYRIVMFINMGKNYELNTDGWVYGLAVEGELVDASRAQPVRLLRVPKNAIADYSAYRYFSGFENGEPRWGLSPTDGVPLDKLKTVALGAAMYHPGVKKYLFLAVPNYPDGPALTLYYADHPWGPWHIAQVFRGEYYIPGILSKDTGPDSFWFTAAGGAGIGDTYQLTMGRIEMKLAD